MLKVMRVYQGFEWRFVIFPDCFRILTSRLLVPFLVYCRLIEFTFVLLRSQLCLQKPRRVYFRVGFGGIAAGVFEDN
jgi:hypothetical protein